MEKRVIKTGVDALVSLVQDKGRISVKEAAKKLNISSSTVVDWASFLEEDGLLNIEYKFTTPFLVKRKLTQKEAEEIKSNIKDGVGMIDRESEITLDYLSKLEMEVDSLKEILKDPKKHFGKKLKILENEINNLKRGEQEIEKLNNQIIKSKEDFIKTIDEANKKLLEQYTKYKVSSDEFYDVFEIGNNILGIQKSEIELIKDADELINKKLKGLRKIIDKNKLSKEKSKLGGRVMSELRVLEDKYGKLRDYLTYEKSITEDLLKENQEHEKQINEFKEEVVSKMKVSNFNIQNKKNELKKETPDKLNILIHEKDKILKILDNINYNKDVLKEKIIDLKNKEYALNKEGTSKNAIDEITELEKELEDVSRKRGFFESEIKKIFGILKL